MKNAFYMYMVIIAFVTGCSSVAKRSDHWKTTDNSNRKIASDYYSVVDENDRFSKEFMRAYRLEEKYWREEGWKYKGSPEAHSAKYLISRAQNGLERYAGRTDSYSLRLIFRRIIEEGTLEENFEALANLQVSYQLFHLRGCKIAKKSFFCFKSSGSVYHYTPYQKEGLLFPLITYAGYKPKYTKDSLRWIMLRARGIINIDNADDLRLLSENIRLRERYENDLKLAHDSERFGKVLESADPDKELRRKVQEALVKLEEHYRKYSIIE